ncbi:MAG: phosphotransferase family protein [Novosphingobium sp.]|nr:phosphotransferase family protein [Novosphingobium sp.]
MDDSGVDLDRLAQWMDGQGLGSGPQEGALRLAGGSQNILLRFSRSGRDYVLRRPPLQPRANSNDTMRREARLLGALAKSQVPHPRLIAACGDEEVLGAAFYLMEPIEGFNPQNGLPETHHAAQVQRRMGEALAEGLAALHALDPFALGLGDFGKLEGFLERQVERWASQLAGYAQLDGWPGPATLGDVQAVADWLEQTRPSDFTAGILHGDYHLANVMYRNDGPELAAIIDWELATVGDPLIDLGWLLATWPQDADGGMLSIEPWNGFPDAEGLVANYAAHAPRSVERLDWYGVFGCYKLGILLEGTYARACAGKAPQDVGERLHGRATWLFARARRWMQTGVLG